jgi:hypothetical protein
MGRELGEMGRGDGEGGGGREGGREGREGGRREEALVQISIGGTIKRVWC